MIKLSLLNKMVVCVGINFIISINAHATVINFSGELGIVKKDLVGATYSGTPVGTVFTGFIDDVTANGMISNGTTQTSFGCCIAAGGLDVSNNFTINENDAIFFNQLSNSSSFSEGDIFDGVNIEGDVITSGTGRIEIGLSYILDADAFSDSNLNNYPFDPNDVLLTLFFITEKNSSGVKIYSAAGQVSTVPLPATIWLFGAGLLGLLGRVKRSK